MTHAADILPANPGASEGMRPILARWSGALAGHAFLIALAAVVLLPVRLDAADRGARTG